VPLRRVSPARGILEHAHEVFISRLASALQRVVARTSGLAATTKVSAQYFIDGVQRRPCFQQQMETFQRMGTKPEIDVARISHFFHQGHKGRQARMAQFELPLLEQL